MSRNYFRFAVYFLVFIGVSSSRAGSFEDFFVALRNDDAQVVTRLLELGFDPDARDEHGQPGLTVALQSRSTHAFMALLEHGAVQVNALNEAGESPLMMAALKGDLADARRLLDRGARVNQPGWNALHYAATGPDVRLVELMLTHGAELEAGSPNGSTALMMAAQYGSEASVELLLRHGADPARRNQLGLTAVDFASRSGRSALAQRLQGQTARPAPEARRVLKRLQFHHTPKHASWLNMVEIEIGVLRSQCLDRRIDDKETILAEVAAWEKRRNAEGAQIQWMFTTEKAREKLRKAYPVKES